MKTGIEFLTSKQNLRIFSRLAAKKKLETDNEELFNAEAEGVEREKMIQKLTI